MTSPDFEIYPDEMERLNKAMEKLAQFEFSKGNTIDRRFFEQAAHSEFGEAGFLINIAWKEIDHLDPLSKSPIPTGVHLPHIEITGRNRKESETDHDRIAHGIVTGKVDGQAGFVREDGTKREDPIRKIIT